MPLESPITLHIGDDGFTAIHALYVKQGRPQYVYDHANHRLFETYTEPAGVFFVQQDPTEPDTSDKSGKWGKYGYIGPELLSIDEDPTEWQP